MMTTTAPSEFAAGTVSCCGGKDKFRRAVKKVIVKKNKRRGQTSLEYVYARTVGFMNSAAAPVGAPDSSDVGDASERLRNVRVDEKVFIFNSIFFSFLVLPDVTFEGMQQPSVGFRMRGYLHCMGYFANNGESFEAEKYSKGMEKGVVYNREFQAEWMKKLWPGDVSACVEDDAVTKLDKEIKKFALDMSSEGTLSKYPQGFFGRGGERLFNPRTVPKWFLESRIPSESD